MPAQKFSRKPVVVEAMQLIPGFNDTELMGWLGGLDVLAFMVEGNFFVEVETENPTPIQPGNWVVYEDGAVCIKTHEAFQDEFNAL